MPEAGSLTVLGVAAAFFLAGSAAGYWIFALCAREPRTELPGSWRLPMATVTGMFCTLLVVRFGLQPVLAPLLVLAVFGVLLGSIDLHTRLLPNRIMLPFLGVSSAALLLSTIADQRWPALLAALAGSAALFAVYLLLALISPASMGMGDVKLAGVLGLHAGFAGVAAWTATLLGGFVLGAAGGILVLALKRGDRKAHFPFGPGMVAAALAGTLLYAS